MVQPESLKPDEKFEVVDIFAGGRRQRALLVGESQLGEQSEGRRRFPIVNGSGMD